MKTHPIQKEILLITGTSFTARQLVENCTPEEPSSSDDKAKLTEICWNGLLSEILPELYRQPDGGKKLFLWSILEGDSFLGLDLGESPQPKEGYFSIDPHFFLIAKNCN